MSKSIKIEGYELITLVAKKLLPLETTIKVIYKANQSAIDNNLFVKTDGDGYYLRWEIDDYEVGNSIFTDEELCFEVEIPDMSILNLIRNK